MAPLAHAARLGRRFRSLLWKPALADEIADELAFHLEMRTRDFAARGLAPAVAAAAARRRFGDLGRVEAACRAIGRDRDRAERRSRWLAETAQDLRLGGRRLAERRASTLAAVLALAVGLAGAATAWRVASAVLRPPPVAAPESLLRLRQLSPQGIDFAATAADYGDWRRLGRSFLGLAAFEVLEANLEDGEMAAPTPPEAPPSPAAAAAAAPAAPERVLAVRATASLLPLLGVRPLLGRGFTAAEAARGGDRRVALLSHALWWRRFAGDPAVLGRIVRLNGEPVRVIGVMPAGFEVPQGAALWLPPGGSGALYAADRDHHRLEVWARLRPESGQRAVAADLAAIAEAVARRRPDTNRGWGIAAEPLAKAWAGARWTRRTRLLLAAAGMLWLLASASAANLLWARATARQREIDLRAALGGGRGRIVRQLAAEAVLVSLLGAAAGLLLAGTATLGLRRAAADLPQLAGLAGPAAAASGAPEPPPGPEPAPPPPATWAAGALAALPRLDLGGAAVVLLLALLSGVACSLGPALQALRPGCQETLRQSARRATRRERRLRDALVVAELAIATTLVIAAGLLLESYLRLDRADPGFDADHVLTLRLAQNGASYPPAARRALLRRIEARLAQLPGVAAAGFASTAPLAAERTAEPFTLERRPAPGGEFLAAEWRVVTPGLFRALGMRRLAGRLLGAGDRDGGHPVAVVDSTLAERCWPGRDPLGQRLRWPAGGRELTVVGVVDRMSDLDLEAGPRPVVFLPYDVAPWRAMALVVRPRAGGARPLQDLGAAVRREVAALAPGLPLSAVRLLEVARREEVAGPRLGLALVALFAAAALALATSGVYATVAAAVARRSQELAVRQALGAAGRDVLQLILGHGAALTVAGLAIGAGGALLFGRLLGGLLYDTSTTHLATYAAASLLLAGVAMLASAVPARRATRIAPVLALRRE